MATLAARPGRRGCRGRETRVRAPRVAPGVFLAEVPRGFGGAPTAALGTAGSGSRRDHDDDRPVAVAGGDHGNPAFFGGQRLHASVLRRLAGGADDHHHRRALHLRRLRFERCFRCRLQLRLDNGSHDAVQRSRGTGDPVEQLLRPHRRLREPALQPRHDGVRRRLRPARVPVELQPDRDRRRRRGGFLGAGRRERVRHRLGNDHVRRLRERHAARRCNSTSSPTPCVDPSPPTAASSVPRRCCAR